MKIEFILVFLIGVLLTVNFFLLQDQGFLFSGSLGSQAAEDELCPFSAPDHVKEMCIKEQYYRKLIVFSGVYY